MCIYIYIYISHIHTPLCEKGPNTEFFVVRILPYLD